MFEAVTIHDLRPLGDGRVLAVDLIDILRLCEADALASSWRVSYVHCLGESAGEFNRLGDSSTTITGPDLFRLATGVSQIIWGDFEAFRPAASRCWLVVRAFDATLYVVATDDRQLLESVRSRFLDVRSSPEDAVWDTESGVAADGGGI